MAFIRKLRSLAPKFAPICLYHAVGHSVQTHRSLFICATFRTGSVLLSDLLRSTGMAGAPEEYFGRILVPPHPGQMAWANTADEDEFFHRVRQLGTTPNGVFGARVHWPHFKSMVRRVRDYLDAPELAAPEALAHMFPEPHFIWLKRRNKVAQAVSYFRAIRSNRWTLASGEMADPNPADDEFDFTEIERLRRRCIIWDACWKRFFASSGIEPIELTYEDFERSMDSTIHSVLWHLGLDVDGFQRARPNIQRQSDDLSEEWIKRFNTIGKKTGILPVF